MIKEITIKAPDEGNILIACACGIVPRPSWVQTVISNGVGYIYYCSTCAQHYTVERSRLFGIPKGWTMSDWYASKEYQEQCTKEQQELAADKAKYEARKSWIEKLFNRLKVES